MIALVAAVAFGFTHAPVQCIDGGSYNALVGAPAATRWSPGGVAGAFVWGSGTVALTNQTCSDLAALKDGYTWQRGEAAFVFAHELGHDLLNTHDETVADCYGAGHAAAVAYAFGLRGRQAFARLERDGVKDFGYQKIPASCFP